MIKTPLKGLLNSRFEQYVYVVITYTKLMCCKVNNISFTFNYVFCYFTTDLHKNGILNILSGLRITKLHLCSLYQILNVSAIYLLSILYSIQETTLVRINRAKLKKTYFTQWFFSRILYDAIIFSFWFLTQSFKSVSLAAIQRTSVICFIDRLCVLFKIRLVVVLSLLN